MNHYPPPGSGRLPEPAVSLLKKAARPVRGESPLERQARIESAIERVRVLFPAYFQPDECGDYDV